MKKLITYYIHKLNFLFNKKDWVCIRKNIPTYRIGWVPETKHRFFIVYNVYKHKRNNWLVKVDYLQ